MNAARANTPVIILGAGGHAKVLIDALQAGRVPILGAVDSDPAKRGLSVLGVNVVGDEPAIQVHQPADILLVNGVGSAESCELRRALFLRWKARGYRFATVIHPSVVIAGSAALGEGTQVLAGAVVQPSCVVGENVILNTKSSIDHDCIIASHCHIAPGVTLSGNVQVGEGTHIGVGSSVIQRIRIGAGTLIGAGSVVVNDVPDGAVAYGVPARVVRGK